MSAARVARCEVCGSVQPLQALEPAVMRYGVGQVCADGLTCAERANGMKPARPALRLVVSGE